MFIASLHTRIKSIYHTTQSAEIIDQLKQASPFVEEICELFRRLLVADRQSIQDVWLNWLPLEFYIKLFPFLTGLPHQPPTIVLAQVIAHDYEKLLPGLRLTDPPHPQQEYGEVRIL